MFYPSTAPFEGCFRAFHISYHHYAGWTRIKELLLGMFLWRLLIMLDNFAPRTSTGVLDFLHDPKLQNFVSGLISSTIISRVFRQCLCRGTDRN